MDGIQDDVRKIGFEWAPWAQQHIRTSIYDE